MVWRGWPTRILTVPTSSRFTVLQQPVITRQSPNRPSHLLAAYSFDTHDGSDASGRGNTLVSQGAGVSFGSGINASATFGTGDVQSACLTGAGVNMQSAVITFMGWINISSAQSGDWVCAFGLHQNSATWPIWGLYPTGGGGGDIVFGSNIGGGSNLNYGPPSPLTDSWHHIACTYDGNTMQLFVDGIFGSSQQKTDGFDYTYLGDFHVLGDPNYGTSRMFAGGVDDVRVYDSVLTQADIQTCMNTPVGMKADPLAG